MAREAVKRRSTSTRSRRRGATGVGSADVDRAPGRGKYDRTRSPDERQKDQLRRLLDAAAHVFAEKGWAEATVETIVTRAGMSRRTFYEHFDDLKDWIDSKSIQRINIKTITLGGLHNIVDSILYCNRNGVGSMVGGTCNETDISAMAMANLAMATSPQSIAGRPGMGVDEGVMTVYNEMVRVGRLEKLRREGR
jgi:enolase